MFEVLTVPARQVLVRATEAATAMGSDRVQGAHLMLGFVDAENTTTHALVRGYLPDRALVARHAQACTPPSWEKHPAQFAQEVSEVLAMARGIAVGRVTDSVGTAACLLALLTLYPRSLEDLLDRCGVDIEAFRAEAFRLDDSDEPMGPPPGESAVWTLTIGEDPVAWDDHPG